MGFQIVQNEVFRKTLSEQKPGPYVLQQEGLFDQYTYLEATGDLILFPSEKELLKHDLRRSGDNYTTAYQLATEEVGKDGFVKVRHVSGLGRWVKTDEGDELQSRPRDLEHTRMVLLKEMQKRHNPVNGSTYLVVRDQNLPDVYHVIREENNRLVMAVPGKINYIA